MKIKVSPIRMGNEVITQEFDSVTVECDASQNPKLPFYVVVSNDKGKIREYTLVISNNGTAKLRLRK